MTSGLILATLLPLALAQGQTQAAKSAQAENARRQQVMQLANKPDETACTRIEAFLTDPSSDIRRRASNALYWKCDRLQVAEAASKLLWRSVEMGNADAGALLLLGYGRPEEVQPWLRKPLPKWAMVKLATSSKPVPAAFAARIALAKTRDVTARADLRKAFEKPTVPEALFLLAALSDIEDGDSLRASVRLLDDTRECPSRYSDLMRTVRDVAVETLVDRLRLKPAFKIEDTHSYTDAELREVREAALKAISEIKQ